MTQAPPILKQFMLCGKCGFMVRSAEATISKKQVADHYQSVDPHRQVAGSKVSFFNHALAAMPEPNNRKRWLLDVGCGYGYFLQMASEKGWQVTGVEIAEDAVKAAKKRFGEENIHHGTIRHASFPGDSFDAVSMWDVLVLAPDPDKELRECFRVLKSGGIIGVRVRNVTFQKWLYRLYLPMKPILMLCGARNPYVFHPCNFSKMAIFHLLHRIGFTDILIYNSPLTKGDPYKTSRWAGPVGTLKKVVEMLSNVLFRSSGGRWVMGPSLLVWGRKPPRKAQDQAHRRYRSVG